MAKDDDILRDAKEAFKLAEDAESKNRAAWLDDMRFARLGEQWPEEMKKKRESEGRPCLTLNRLPSFIRQVTNDARQNKPSIKCHAVDSDASEETAEIINGLIRNIEYTSNADVAYDTALDHAVTGGYGYFRISTDYTSDDSFDQDLRIERVVNPLTIYGDPYSREADSSDWNTAFVTEMLSTDEFKRRYPKAQASDWDSSERDAEWVADEKVRIAEYWTREEVVKNLLKLSDGSVMYEDMFLKAKDLLDMQGITVVGERPTKSHKVTQRIITPSEVLETNKWAGRYIPIVPVFGDELNIEGERHFLSLVRFAKDPQMMFNFWRTASTELVALAPKIPFIGPRGSFNTDASKWATANTDNHAYIEYDPVAGQLPPQRQPFAGPPAGALQEAANAEDDMKSIMGLYDASLGAKSNETSGKAILARQREGDVSTFNYVDNLSRALRHAGRIIVDMIPAVYDLPRIIRVIHEDGKNENVTVNAPYQVRPPEKPEDQDPDEQKEFLEGVTKLYDLTVGKYDVTVEAGPSFTTKREEAATQMMQMVQAMPQTAPMIGDLIAKNLDWPGADEIAKRLKAMLPQQIQGQNPQVMQMQQQLQHLDGQAKQMAAQLEQEKNDKSLEARKLDIDAYGKETDRLKVMGTAMGPEQVQALVVQTIQSLMSSPDILPGQRPQPQMQPPGNPMGPGQPGMMPNM